MPKETNKLISRAKKMIGNAFEVHTKSSEVFIFCKTCESKFKIDSIHLNTQYQSHLKSSKHTTSSEKRILQPSISTVIAKTNANNNKVDSYSIHLLTAFLEAGIPVYKLKHRSIRKFFLEKHKEVLPCVSTFYNKIDSIYALKMQKIKEYIDQYPIYLVVDETTDECKRIVVNVLVGKLDGTAKKPVLLSTAFLDKMNNTTIQQAVNKACVMLYGSDIPYEKIWLLITDQAPYMIKAGKGLKQIYTNLNHVTCMIHGLNRICEFVKDKYDDVNELIASMKAVLSKSNNRRQKYYDFCKLPLPPDVIEIRWNFWFHAAFFYAENFTSIKSFPLSLENSSSKSVTRLKNAISNRGLENSLYEINKYKFLTEAITSLEKQGLTVSEQLAILNSVERKLSGADSEKFGNVLKKNPDWNFLEKMPVDQKIKCEFAPLVSVDVERSFSTYKYVLSDRRHSLSESHIKMLNCIQFNHFLDDEMDKEN